MSCCPFGTLFFFNPCLFPWVLALCHRRKISDQGFAFFALGTFHSSVPVWIQFFQHLVLLIFSRSHLHLLTKWSSPYISIRGDTPSGDYPRVTIFVWKPECFQLYYLWIHPNGLNGRPSLLKVHHLWRHPNG